MNIKQTMRNLVLGVLLLLGVTLAVLPANAEASCTSGQPCCGGVTTAIISCSQPDPGKSGTVEDTGIWGVLVLTINIMISLIGVLAVAGFVYGGFLYMTAGGSPEQVKKARTVFVNVVIGILAFGGMWALLNFLIPGGVFH